MIKGMLAPHTDSHLAAWADQLGPTGLFVRYMLDQCPEAGSLAVFEGDEVVATAVSGRPYDRREVESYWVHATDAEAMKTIVAMLPTWDVAITYPLESRSIIAATHPHLKHSIRPFLVQPRPLDAATADSPEPLQLDGRSLESLSIPSELQRMIGRFSDWSEGSNLFGIVENGELRCICETTVRDRRYAAIQRLCTTSSGRSDYRSDLARWITRKLHEDRLIPVQVISESDVEALQLAQRLGFEPVTDLGYAH